MIWIHLLQSASLQCHNDNYFVPIIALLFMMVIAPPMHAGI